MAPSYFTLLNLQNPDFNPTLAPILTLTISLIFWPHPSPKSILILTPTLLLPYPTQPTRQECIMLTAMVAINYFIGFNITGRLDDRGLSQVADQVSTIQAMINFGELGTYGTLKPETAHHHTILQHL